MWSVGTYIQDLHVILYNDFVARYGSRSSGNKREMHKAICIRLIVDLWPNYCAEAEFSSNNNATGFVYGDNAEKNDCTTVPAIEIIKYSSDSRELLRSLFATDITRAGPLGYLASINKAPAYQNINGYK